MSHETADTLRDTTGILGWIIGVGSWIVEKMELIPINDILTGISITVAIVWSVYKVIETRLSIKIKKQIIKQNEK